MVDGAFPASELASFATFEIAPSIPTAPVDSGSGIAPLPLDLLRTANSGKTIAFNPSFGPAAQGLTTLDGFSTTALIFAPVTVPVDVSTVNACNVLLYKLANGGATLLAEFQREAGASAGAGCLPTGVGPAAAAYLIEPTPLTTTQGNFVVPGVQCAAAGGCSTLIALQPAVGVPSGPGFYLPPLDEATDYAVVITTSVKDMLGRPLQKSTIGKILTSSGFDPVATSSVDGKSRLSGIPDATATALQKMREQLAPVLASLPGGRTAADVALAFTFRTQGGIAQVQPLNLPLPLHALTLAKYPYGTSAGVVTDPDAVTTFTPAEHRGHLRHRPDHPHDPRPSPSSRR